MAFHKGMNVSREVLDRAKSAPTIGYWSCMGGVEVKFIEDGDDYETYVTGLIGTFAGTPKPFQRKVQYTLTAESRAYINLNGTHLFLDECIRNPL